MALNPSISKIRAMSAKKIAGVHSLTLGECVAFALLLVVMLWKEKVPIVKGWSQRTAQILALGFLFLILWID